MKIRYLLSVLLLLTISSSVSAQESLVRLLSGRLKLQLGTQARFLTHQDAQKPLEVKLLVGERIQTGRETQAEVSLRGGEEVIQLRSGSLFTVNDLSRKQTKLSMPIGKAKFKVDPRRKLKRRFQVRTTTAIVGVRGTEFVMGAGEGQTSMLTLSGAVEMASVEAPAVKVQVNIGQASKLVVGKAPTPPVSVPPELRASIAEGDSTESFEVVSFPPAQDIEEAAAEQEQVQDTEDEPKQDAEEEDNPEEERIDEAPAEEDALPEDEEPALGDPTLDGPAVETPELEVPEEIEIDLGELDALNDLLEEVNDTVNEAVEEAAEEANETERTIKIYINE